MLNRTGGLMRIGMGLHGFFKIPIHSVFKKLKQIGYDGIEIYAWQGYIIDQSVLDENTLTSEIWKKIKRNANEVGLDIPAMHVADIKYFENPCKETLKGKMEFTKRCVDFAADLDMNFVNIMSGKSLHRPGGEVSVEEAWEEFFDFIATCVDHASERGIILALEPHVDFLIDSVEPCLRILNAVKSENLRVNFDLSHFSIHGWDIPSAVHKLSKYIVHTHLKSTRGRYPNYEFLIPGEGEDNEILKEFISTLNDIGYKGYLSVEVAHARRVKLSYDPFNASALAYKTISTILSNLNIER